MQLAAAAERDLDERAAVSSPTEADAVLAWRGRRRRWLLTSDDDDALGDRCECVAFPISNNPKPKGAGSRRHGKPKGAGSRRHGKPKGARSRGQGRPACHLCDRQTVRAQAQELEGTATANDATGAVARRGPVLFELTALLGSDCNRTAGVGPARAREAAAACCDASPAPPPACGIHVDLDRLVTILCPKAAAGVTADEVRESVERERLRLHALEVCRRDGGTDGNGDDGDEPAVPRPLHRLGVLDPAASAKRDAVVRFKLRVLPWGAVWEPVAAACPRRTADVCKPGARPLPGAATLVSPSSRKRTSSVCQPPRSPTRRRPARQSSVLPSWADRRPRLDVVVREGPAVLEILAREGQPLLVRRDVSPDLDLDFDTFDAVRRPDRERDEPRGN